MPFPSPRNFGIVDNPLVDSPFVESEQIGGGVPVPSNRFLLSDGSSFLLSDGSFLLLSP